MADMKRDASDARFLMWIRDRLVYVHGDRPAADFIHRLNEIIAKVEKADG